MIDSRPIGVFDSGVGGLSVLREIRRQLPHEDLVYVADSAHLPYGEKSREFITTRALAITGFLTSQQVKAVVVACNTATSAAITTLRAHFSLPIVAMEPAIKPAIMNSKSRVIGVLATGGTLASENFRRLLARLASEVEVLIQPCPGLVERVEAGELSGVATQTLVERYVLPLLAQGADTLVLGCTHYAFLAPLLQDCAGAGVVLIDSSAAVARELKRRLSTMNLATTATHPGRERFYTSGSPARIRAVIARYWGTDVALKALPACEQREICLPEGRG